MLIEYYKMKFLFDLAVISILSLMSIIFDSVDEENIDLQLSWVERNLWDTQRTKSK